LTVTGSDHGRSRWQKQNELWQLIISRFSLSVEKFQCLFISMPMYVFNFKHLISGKDYNNTSHRYCVSLVWTVKYECVILHFLKPKLTWHIFSYLLHIFSILIQTLFCGEYLDSLRKYGRFTPSLYKLNRLVPLSPPQPTIFIKVLKTFGAT
jgi:hypothetical protein